MTRLRLGRLTTAMALASLVLIGGPALADQSIRVAAEHTLSTTGSTRGTAYGSANKIITLGNRTHVAWLDTASRTMIRTYDRETDQWLPTVHVGTGLDNHGGPAMCADSKGYLHMVFGPHHGPLQYVRSERANDASSWVKLPGFGDHATYPSIVCDADDTLYCAYRGKTAPFRLLLQRKPKDGDWTEPKVIVDAGVPDGYTQFGNCLCLGPRGTLHLAFHVYDMHPAAGKAVGHLQSANRGDTWALADGTPVELPFTPDNEGWLVKDPEYDMRCWTVDCDTDGNPYVCIVKYGPEPREAQVWAFRSGAWGKIDTATALATTGQELKASGATLAFDQTGNLYVAMSAGPKGGWSLPGNEIFVLVSSDRGKSFEVVPVSTPNPRVPNWLPSIERATGHNLVSAPWLLYTHGEKGEGCTPADVTQIRAVRLQRD